MCHGMCVVVLGQLIRVASLYPVGPRIKPKAASRCHGGNTSWDHAALQQTPGYEDRAMLGVIDKLGDGKEASHQAQEKPGQTASFAAFTASLTQPEL